MKTRYVTKVDDGTLSGFDRNNAQPRVARASQPWADMSNPVGIEEGCPQGRNRFGKRAFSERGCRPDAGFTLTEIMVVLIVIGIIAAAIIPQFIGTTQDAKVSAAKGNVSELEAAVERFYVHMDRYPTTEEGLKVLVQAPTGEETKWRGPYIKMLRNDPWGQPYQYRSPGTHHASSFDLWSKGADGADGGEGPNADVGNWQ